MNLCFESFPVIGKMGLTWELQGSCKGVKSEEIRVKNLSLFFRSWPLIGKRDLNSSLFTLRSSLIWCKGTNFFPHFK